MIRTPRLVIAGTHSGVGKTTVATALMAAFTRRGLRVQPFKVGPDFIDPGFHEAACGRPGRNLDGWMLSRSGNLETFARACADADLAIIEGVMGLFDGRDAAGDTGSTAEMAKWLQAPVLLVADVSAMARSAAALVSGFEQFDPDLDVAGVLLNRVGGTGHAELLRAAITANCRTLPAAFLPHVPEMELRSRHLGLTLAAESLTGASLERMSAWVEKHADLDALLRVAREHATELPDARPLSCIPPRVRIGVACDAAFCFYYRDNLDLLRACGAELIEFSPIEDAQLPPGTRGLYLGGGYPELHASRLAANKAMRDAVQRFAQSGAPVFAECGGFMYLTKAIVDLEGREYPMAGVFPTCARMRSGLAALGYLEAAPAEDTLWLRRGERLRGHEFRYSDIDAMPHHVHRSLVLSDGKTVRREGYSSGHVLAGYAHFHFGSAPEFARRFVEACI